MKWGSLLQCSVLSCLSVFSFSFLCDVFYLLFVVCIDENELHCFLDLLRFKSSQFASAADHIYKPIPVNTLI